METNYCQFLFSQEMSSCVSSTALILQDLLPVGPAKEILGFLFWDKRDHRFARHLRQKFPGYDQCLKMVDNAKSRKNGFIHGDLLQENFDMDTEDWIFEVEQEDLFLQADNCRVCGGYSFSNNTSGIARLVLCHCS